jgi:DNA mismatch repair protein MSH5
MGKKLLHTWHLRPLTGIGAIAARHDAIDMLVFPGNQFPVEHMRRAMKQVGNVGGICMKIRKNRGTWRDWRKIMDVGSSHFLYMIVGELMSRRYLLRWK